MSQPAIGHHLADVLYSMVSGGVLHAIGDNDTKDRAPAPLGVSADSLDQASDGVVERCSAAWLILAIRPGAEIQTVAQRLEWFRPCC